MIALVDIGNTRTKYCFVNNKQREQINSIENDKLSNNYLSEHFNQVDKIIVASVSHSGLTDTVELWCKEHKICYQRVVSEKSRNSIISAYHKPSQLGVDRWLTLIAAHELYPKENILIIDAGTATTIDLLAASGEHQGGWILAGIDTLFNSVLNNTSQVWASSNRAASLAFGTSSSENVNNATWAATVGAISQSILQSEQQGITINKILVTGGNGQSLTSLLSYQSILVEDLVFVGLQDYI